MLALLAAATLTFTLPSQVQDRWMVWDEDLADSVLVGDCSPGAPMNQLLTARLWYIPVTGGGWRIAQEHSVAGREGQLDSFVVDPGPGGHYYVSTTNPAGESCASGEVYLPGSVTTSVEAPQEAQGEVLRADVFDVQGRRVGSVPMLVWPPPSLPGMALLAWTGRRLPSGIYFLRGTTKRGSVRVKRVALVR